MWLFYKQLFKIGHVVYNSSPRGANELSEIRSKLSSRSFGNALPVQRTLHVNIHPSPPLVSSDSFLWLLDVHKERREMNLFTVQVIRRHAVQQSDRRSFFL